MSTIVYDNLDQLSDSVFNLGRGQVVHSKEIIGLSGSGELVDASVEDLETVFSEGTRNSFYAN